LGARHASTRAAKKAVILAADAVRVSSVYRRLHRDDGRTLPVALCWDTEPDLPPQGALEPGEIVNGLSPDFRGVPLTPYRSNPDVFPAADPASRSDPLLIPLTTAPRRGDGASRILTPYMIPSLFARRLLQITRKVSPPVLALAIGTDHGAIGSWEVIGRNLEHLARVPGVQFVTAGTAATELRGAT